MFLLLRRIPIPTPDGGVVADANENVAPITERRLTYDRCAFRMRQCVAFAAGRIGDVNVPNERLANLVTDG